MASSRNTALRPHFKELAIPSGIPLTPAVCTEIFAQFLKQILYRRGQIECTFEQYMKLHTANQEKPRLTAKELKVHHLFKTMRECTESMLKIFEHHSTSSMSSAIGVLSTIAVISFIGVIATIS